MREEEIDTLFALNCVYDEGWRRLDGLKKDQGRNELVGEERFMSETIPKIKEVLIGYLVRGIEL